MVKILMKFRLTALLLLVAFTSVSALAQQPTAVMTPENQALKVAREWLELVDKGSYSRSWHEASSLFKSAI